MSHLSVVKTKVRIKDRDILKKALERVADQLGCELVEGGSIRIFGGEMHDAEFVLDYGSGIGIDVVGDELVVKADFFLVRISAEQLTRMIKKEYATEAAKLALAELGFDVQEEVSEKTTVLIGVR